MLSTAEVDPSLTLAYQMLKMRSNISGSGDIKATGKVFADKMCALWARRKATVWEVLSELDGLQVIPGQLFHFLSALYQD